MKQFCKKKKKVTKNARLTRFDFFWKKKKATRNDTKKHEGIIHKETAEEKNALARAPTAAWP